MNFLKKEILAIYHFSTSIAKSAFEDGKFHISKIMKYILKNQNRCQSFIHVTRQSSNIANIIVNFNDNDARMALFKKYKKWIIWIFRYAISFRCKNTNILISCFMFLLLFFPSLHNCFKKLISIPFNFLVGRFEFC